MCPRSKAPEDLQEGEWGFGCSMADKAADVETLVFRGRGLAASQAPETAQTPA